MSTMWARLQRGSRGARPLHNCIIPSATQRWRERRSGRGRVFDDRGVGGSRAELRSNQILKKWAASASRTEADMPVINAKGTRLARPLLQIRLVVAGLLLRRGGLAAGHAAAAAAGCGRRRNQPLIASRHEFDLGELAVVVCVRGLEVGHDALSLDFATRSPSWRRRAWSMPPCIRLGSSSSHCSLASLSSGQMRAPRLPALPSLRD